MTADERTNDEGGAEESPSGAMRRGDPPARPENARLHTDAADPGDDAAPRDDHDDRVDDRPGAARPSDVGDRGIAGGRAGGTGP
jgi:hypothetical protein